MFNITFNMAIYICQNIYRTSRSICPMLQYYITHDITLLLLLLYLCVLYKICSTSHMHELIVMHILKKFYVF